jgi:hypothetical protein
VNNAISPDALPQHAIEFRRNISPLFRSLALFLNLVSINLIVRAQSSISGFSVDDYSFASNPRLLSYLDLANAQGRFGVSLFLWFFDATGISLIGPSFLFIIFAILSQALLITVILQVLFPRLSTVSKTIAGGLLLSHPYWSELYTFKAASFSLSVVNLSIAASLLLIFYPPARIRFSWLISIITILFSLTVYQTSINVLVIILFFLVLTITTASNDNYEETIHLKISAKRMIISMSASLAIYLVILKIYASLFSGSLNSRTDLLKSEGSSGRVEEAFSTLKLIYFGNEPIFPFGAKILYLMVACISFFFISRAILGTRKWSNFFVFIGIWICFPFLTLGVALVIEEWWPTPRLLQHVGLIYGLSCALALNLVLSSTFTRILATFAVISALIGGMLNNQIFNDQRRINDLDRLTSSRIMSQLESSSGFENVEALAVVGSFWTYETPLKTVQMDMNISAFATPWSKVSVIEFSTGHVFRGPDIVEQDAANLYCASSPRWPLLNSTTIIDKMAVVCLSSG